MATARADKARRPPEPLQVGRTRPVIREHQHELTGRSRIDAPDDKRWRFAFDFRIWINPYILYQEDLTDYPLLIFIKYRLT